jgi:hypothetical protein
MSGARKREWKMKKLPLILTLIFLVSPSFASDSVQGLPSWWDAQFNHNVWSTGCHAGLSFGMGFLTQAIWKTTGDEGKKPHDIYLTALIGSLPMGFKDFMDTAVGGEGWRDSFIHSALDYVVLDYGSALAGAAIGDLITGPRYFDEFALNIGPYSRVTYRF